jgi:hypothetical protein
MPTISQIFVFFCGVSGRGDGVDITVSFIFSSPFEIWKYDGG